MQSAEALEYFLPMIVRPWSNAGRAAGLYRPYYGIQIADLIGAAASLGFTPVYETAEALRREHPIGGELFFSKDSRLFPAICRRWVSEYYPAQSIGYVPVYATLKGLRADFPEAPYTSARLDLEDFRLPLAGKVSKEDFAEPGSAEAPRNPKERADFLISLPNTERVSPG